MTEGEDVDEKLRRLRAGDLIMVRNADGDLLRKRAFGPVKQGGSFPVVWACREEEWQAAIGEGREPEGMPWPAVDVTVPDTAASS